MPSKPIATPAFGEADLSNCELEQIHLAGSIQPHGALLVVRESDCSIIQASENASAFLGLPHDVIGRPLHDLDGDLFDIIVAQGADTLGNVPLGVRCRIGNPGRSFDCLIHRPPEGGLIIELEQAGPPVDLAKDVEKALRTIVGSASLRILAEETASIFKTLTGYDRVMVYRFDQAGHGEVFSERRRPDLEPFLGNWYPASDIPQIARRLYERNRVRVLVDVDYQGVPLVPRYSPVTGRDLDMSLCFLRSMSPIHIQYLKNMGVGATLVVSLLVGGKLWGLIACHHYSPRFVHFETRAVCEILAEAIGTRIAALEGFAQVQAELSVRRLEQRLIEAISRDGDWRGALFDSAPTLLQPLNAAGAALLFDDQVLVAGDVPGTQELRQIAAWLDRQPGNEPVIATATLGLDEPAFADLAAVACGIVATRVSNLAGEYLVWFRPERIRTVTWGGDPTKPVVVGDNPADLSPRRSFAQWHQLVEGTSEAWSASELTAARLIGTTIADVILQFRSLRMLIAEEQLERVKRQVGSADTPVIIADPDGVILLANESFDRLLAPGHPAIGMVKDLPRYFVETEAVLANLQQLVEGRRPWRGEAHLRDRDGRARPVLARADPVFSAPGRILGYILLFTDASERDAASKARSQFQDSIIERHQGFAVRLDSKSDLAFRNLLSTVVENAQLAALEITDGVDAARIPGMLESVRSSVSRTAEVLKILIWHASRSSGEDR